MKNLFRRRLDWLYGALGLNEPSIPVELETEAVLPVLDVLQGGRPFGEVRFLTHLHQGTNPAVWVAVQPEPEKQHRILYATCQHIGTGSFKYVEIRLLHPDLQSDPLLIKRFAVDPNEEIGSIGQTTTWSSGDTIGILGAQYAPVEIPPGWGIRIFFPPLPEQGEMLRLSLLVETLPAGIRP